MSFALTWSGRESARDADAVDTPAACATLRSVGASGEDFMRRRRATRGFGSMDMYALRCGLALGSVTTEHSDTCL
ncbi:MAG: hypothetical protein ABI537_07015 [Casimicrobiaceae bacterium]